MAQIIDGKARAQEIRQQIALDVAKFREESGTTPCLAAVLVGEDPASQTYVRNKEKACVSAGMESRVIRLPADTSQKTLLELVAALNLDPEVHGILVQLPLPRHMDPEVMVEAIDPLKDVDGFHAVTLGKLFRGTPTFLPCTPAGVVDLIRTTGQPLRGREAVIIGRSLIVGRPLAHLLLAENMTVTVCHSQTRDLPAVARRGDLLVAAVGKADMVTGDFVKPGAIVIDVGINRNQDGKLTGDVAYHQALDKAAYITPVPGGVGPMTIAMLLKNVLTAARLQSGVATAQTT